MSIPKQLETTRLTLRAFDRSDAAELEACWGRNVEHLTGEVTLVAGRAMTAYLERVERAFAGGAVFLFGVRTRDGQLVGGAGLGRRADGFELTYWLDGEQTGRGYATEAVAELVRIALAQPDVRTVRIRCRANNARSAGVARRLGFAAEPAEADELSFVRAKVPDEARLVAIADVAGSIEIVDEAIRCQTMHGAVELRVGQAPVGTMAIATCDVAGDDELPAHDLLAHNASLAVGAFCAAAGRLLLRLVVPIEALTPEALVLLAHEAARLGRVAADRRRTTFDCTPFAHYA